MNFVRNLLLAAVICVPLFLCSCNKIGGVLKNVDGKVAGQVLNQAGRGRGYVSVELAPEAGGENIITTAEEMGNFLFDTVPSGTYTMRVKLASGTELASDTPKVKVGPGRTMTQNILLTGNE